MQLLELLIILQLYVPIVICMVGPTQAETNVNLMESSMNDLYRTSDVLLTEIQALVSRHPLVLSVEDLQAAANGYRAEIRVVTVEFGGRNASSAEKLRLLLDFGQHGRELVTSEVALRLMRILVGEHNSLFMENPKLHRILSNSVIKIVAMENVSGRKKVEAGDFCERKNGRGVDTNRNWGLDWGKKEKDYDPAEEYPGTAPFSEPETRILRGLAENFKPHLWVNVHSGMEALFMPYDHKNTMPDDGSAEHMLLLLQAINRLHCNSSCTVGSGGGAVGYLAHGTATDYMFDGLRVPLAFTFEIYGDSKASNEECFRMFNPVSMSHFEQVVSNWSEAFITLILNLPTALRSMPGRVWAQARQSDWSNSEAIKFGAQGSDGRPLRMWPGMDAGIGQTFHRRNEGELAMHQFLIFLVVLWGLALGVVVYILCKHGYRWRKSLQWHPVRRPAV